MCMAFFWNLVTKRMQNTIPMTKMTLVYNYPIVKLYLSCKKDIISYFPPPLIIKRYLFCMTQIYRKKYITGTNIQIYIWDILLKKTIIFQKNNFITGFLSQLHIISQGHKNNRNTYIQGYIHYWGKKSLLTSLIGSHIAYEYSYQKIIHNS